MSPKQADQLIRAGQPVTLTNTHFNETFTVVLVRRDRWNVYTDTGATLDRGELEVTQPAN